MEQPKNITELYEEKTKLTLRERMDGAAEIDLVELFYRLLASWKWIAAAAAAGMILAFLITYFLVTPLYRASSTIYVLTRKDSAINMSDLQIGAALTQDYVKVFDMWEVHEEVISNLDLPYSYSQMRSHLSVTNATGTRMLQITFTSPYPYEAAAVANEYAKVASNFIAETMSTDKPNIVSVALVPTSPYSPSLVKNVAIGFMAGLVVAVGIVFLIMMTDDKIKTAEDIRKYTGLVNLAIVPMEDIPQQGSGNDKKKKKEQRAAQKRK